jgi:hypothetical protein
MTLSRNSIVDISRSPIAPAWQALRPRGLVPLVLSGPEITVSVMASARPGSCPYRHGTSLGFPGIGRGGGTGRWCGAAPSSTRVRPGRGWARHRSRRLSVVELAGPSTCGGVTGMQHLAVLASGVLFHDSLPLCPYRMDLCTTWSVLSGSRQSAAGVLRSDRGIREPGPRDRMAPGGHARPVVSLPIPARSPWAGAPRPSTRW